MPAKWTGRLVGLMHVHRITQTELAVEAGWSRKYTSSVLNSDYTSGHAQKVLTNALDRLLEKRTQS